MRFFRHLAIPVSACLAALIGFSAPALATGLPVVTTGQASNVASTSATLNGTVNPDGLDTTCHLQYGLTASYGTPGTTQDLGAGTTAVPVSETDTGLSPSTTYHFRLNCTNSAGNVKGADATFTTLAGTASAPSVSGLSASGVTSSSATLKGAVNPNGAATTCHFGYGLTTTYGTALPNQGAGAGTSPVNLSATATGLSPSTLYHFHLHCTNSAGAGDSGDGTFTTSSGGGGSVGHIVWVAMENHSYSQIIGNTASAPYINSLANTYGSATNMTAEGHPSLPNYIAMTSGSTQGITDDSGPSSHPLNVANVFKQLPAGGSRSLEESMPSACDKGNSGNYAVRHNPEAYYTNLGTDCASFDVPLAATPDLSAKFTFITPNLCHDMHSNSCAGNSNVILQGDNFLKSFVPQLLNSPQYQAGNTVIFITWDEDNTSNLTPNQVPTLIIDPFAGNHDTSACQGTHYTHYSMLKYTEDTFALPELAGGAGANSMRGCFGLP